MEKFPLLAPRFDGASRRVEIEAPFEWLKKGWALFALHPTVGAIMALILIAVMLGLGRVPGIGGLIIQLLSPVFTAGFLVACRKSASDETPEVADLFAGFKEKLGALAMIGVIYMAGSLLIMLVVLLLSGGSLVSGLMTGNLTGVGIAVGGLMVALLLSMLLFIPLLMAIFFAPPLVLFNDMKPLEACTASFHACVKNILPMLLYGVIAFILMCLAALPMGLGFLLLIPVLSGSLYAAHRDIFLAQ